MSTLLQSLLPDETMTVTLINNRARAERKAMSKVDVQGKELERFCSLVFSLCHSLAVTQKNMQMTAMTHRAQHYWLVTFVNQYALINQRCRR